MFNFAICDDNEGNLDKLEKMLQNIFCRHSLPATVCCATSSPSDILDVIAQNKIDVFLLDIQLKSDKTGLDLAEAIRKINKTCYIIFTTGHLEYSMVAYKFHAFDYLAKPLNYDRLEETILRLFEYMHETPKRYLVLDNKNTMLDSSEVQYIKRDGMKLVFHTSTRDYTIYSSFNKFQDKLPSSYKRCHKSYIANTDQIVDIEPVSATITFKDGSSCNIGPKYKSDLLEVLNSYETC